MVYSRTDENMLPWESPWPGLVVPDLRLGRIGLHAKAMIHNRRQKALCLGITPGWRLPGPT